MKCLVCDKDVIDDCESSSPFHYFYFSNELDLIRVDKGNYFIILRNSNTLEAWVDISGKYDKLLYKINCDLESFSKLCKLEANLFNHKIKLLNIFS